MVRLLLLLFSLPLCRWWMTVRQRRRRRRKMWIVRHRLDFGRALYQVAQEKPPHKEVGDVKHYSE